MASGPGKNLNKANSPDLRDLRTSEKEEAKSLPVIDHLLTSVRLCMDSHSLEDTIYMKPP